jgi:hypothetical protein
MTSPLPRALAALGLGLGAALPCLAAETPNASPPAAPTAEVEAVEVTTRAPVVGDLKQGVLDYRPEFFTPVRPGTAMDMIKWLPGFTFEDTRDVRGLNAALGNVLIDGKPPASKTDTLTTVLARIPANQVERIDLIVGAAPGIDMRGKPVMANIILKKSTKPRGNFIASTYIDRQGRFGPTIQYTVSRNRNDRLLEGGIEFGQFMRNTTFGGAGPWVRYDGSGAVLFAADTDASNLTPYLFLTGAMENPVAGGKLKINGVFRWLNGRIEERDVLTTQPGEYSLLLDELVYQGEVGGRYTRTEGRYTLETQGLVRRTTRDAVTDIRRPPADSRIDNDERVTELVGGATLRFKSSEKLTLEASAEGTRNTLSTLGQRQIGGVPVALQGGDVGIEENRGELGANMIWKPSGLFSLTAGMKREASRLVAVRDVSLTRELGYWKPRVIASFTPDKNTQLRLRVEREVGQISFGYFVTLTELNTETIQVGNPNLRPQTNWTVEGVFERRFWTGGTANLTVRRQALRDVTDTLPLFAGGTLVTVAGNIGDGRRTDVIGSLTVPLKRLGLGGLMARGGFTRAFASATDPTTGLKRRPSNVYDLVWDAHLVHDLPRWKLTWGVDANYYGRKAAYRPTGIDRFAPYSRVNLYVEYRPSPPLNLRVELDNAFADDQPERITFYGGPRHASPLAFLDDRRPNVGRFVFLRLRRTFG